MKLFFVSYSFAWWFIVWNKIHLEIWRRFHQELCMLIYMIYLLAFIVIFFTIILTAAPLKYEISDVFFRYVSVDKCLYIYNKIHNLSFFVHTKTRTFHTFVFVLNAITHDFIQREYFKDTLSKKTFISA